METVKTIAAALAALVGVVTLYLLAWQITIRRRAHLLEVYKHTFDLVDSPEIRTSRRYVYKMDRTVYQQEHWLDLDQHEDKAGHAMWNNHPEMAELVARAFDRYGLLVREGRVPMNILARFYASPALRCWFQLGPYINAVRNRRSQTGHMWEWENLIFEIIRPGLRRNKGVWKGVSKHDQLEGWLEKAEQARKDMQSDTDYAPKGRTWELGPWWKFWRW